MKSRRNIKRDPTCQAVQQRRRSWTFKSFWRTTLVTAATCSATSLPAMNIPGNEAFPLGCSLVGRTTLSIPQTDEFSQFTISFGPDRRSLFQFYQQTAEGTANSDKAKYQVTGRQSQQPTRFLVLVAPRPGAKEAANSLYDRVKERWLKTHVDDLNSMPVPFQVYDPCSLVDCEISIVYRSSDQLPRILTGTVRDRFFNGIVSDDLFQALQRPLLSYRIFSINGVPTIVFDRWRKERVEGLSGNSSDSMLLASGAWRHRREDPEVIFIDDAEVKPLAEFQREIVADLTQSGSDPKLGMRFVQYLDKQWKECIRRDFNGNIQKYINSKTKRD